jgi:hypothetical protein
MTGRRIVLNEEQKLKVQKLMDQNYSLAFISKTIDIGSKTLRKLYPNYRNYLQLEISEEVRPEVEKLMEMRLKISEICRQTGVSDKAIRKFYPGYLGAKTSGGYSSSKDKSKKIPSSHIDKDALYSPKRDKVTWHPTLTAQLLGDPPPGRREMLEKWSQNSK